MNFRSYSCPRAAGYLILLLLVTALFLPGQWQGLQPLGSASAGQYDPVANGGNWTFLEPGNEVLLSSLGSYDPDDDINGNGRIDENETDTLQFYEWDFDGDGVFDWNSTKSGTVTRTYNETGNFTALLRVTDVDDNIATDEFLVFVYTEEEPDDDPDFDPTFFLIIGIVEVVSALVLFYAAFEIRKHYYSNPEIDFDIFTKEDEKKMGEERKEANRLEKEAEFGKQDKPAPVKKEE